MGITALVTASTIVIPVDVFSTAQWNPRICPEAVHGNAARVMVLKDLDTVSIFMVFKYNRWRAENLSDESAIRVSNSAIIAVYPLHTGSCCLHVVFACGFSVVIPPLSSTMLDICATNVLLALLVWIFACYVAVTRFSAVQKLIAFGLHCVLRQCTALSSNVKPSYRVTSSPSGAVYTPGCHTFSMPMAHLTHSAMTTQ